MNEDTLFLKIIVVGDSGVGKTSLLNRFCYDKFENNTQPTIGCDFCTKVITNFNGKTLRMQLWDVAGFCLFLLIKYQRNYKKDKKDLRMFLRCISGVL